MHRFTQIGLRGVPDLLPLCCLPVKFGVIAIGAHDGSQCSERPDGYRGPTDPRKPALFVIPGVAANFHNHGNERENR